MSIINFRRRGLMEMQASNQLISSHLKEYPIKDYFVGLDIGTSSVGWAVTNKSYELLKFRSHKMWGSRLFDEGELAVVRRGFRSMRRRLERRKLRLKLLEELFADAMIRHSSCDFVKVNITMKIKRLDIALNIFYLLIKTTLIKITLKSILLFITCVQS